MSERLLALVGVASLASACVAADDGTLIASTQQQVSASNGLRMNGIRMNGIRMNGIRMNGIRMNGIRMNGIRMNGIRLNGVRMNGLSMDGLPLAAPTNVHGVTYDGFSLGELLFLTSSYAGAESWDINTVALRGTEVLLSGGEVGLIPHKLTEAMDRSGADLSDEDEDRALVLLDRLVACAAAPGVTIRLDTRDGSRTLPTAPMQNRGVDPTFITDGPDLSKTSAVADCMLETGGFNYVPLFEEAFDTYVSYWASCLANSGDSIGVEQLDGSMKYYDGGLGLAPWVVDAPLAPAPDAVAAEQGADVGERRLSSCLAARVNVLGEHVMLSFRGTTINSTGGIVVDGTEAEDYPVREGAFWGNMFSDTPRVFTCIGEGRSLSEGRLCARDASACGFEVRGDCPGTGDSSLTAEHMMTGCQGARDGGSFAECGIPDDGSGTYILDYETEVITTFIRQGVCGNGTREFEEECDDGNDALNDGCTPGCMLEYCGDGIENGSEECDDGNDINGDGCSSACTFEGGDGGGDEGGYGGGFCGDGIVDAGEECDDGNNVSGDGCSSACTFEDLPEPEPEPEPEPIVCGDGAVGAGEQCDDGNLVDGDGCSSTCTTESSRKKRGGKK